MRKGTKLAKEHICKTQGHRPKCGDGQREGGWGWVEVGKGGGEWGHLKQCQ